MNTETEIFPSCEGLNQDMLLVVACFGLWALEQGAARPSSALSRGFRRSECAIRDLRVLICEAIASVSFWANLDPVLLAWRR